MAKLIEFPLSNGGTVLLDEGESPTPPGVSGAIAGTAAEVQPDSNVATPIRGWRDQSAGSGSAASVGMVIRGADRSFEQAVESIRSAAEVLVDRLQTLSGGPEDISIEFGLQMSAQAGAFIAQAATAAHFKVTLAWHRDNSSDQT